jgi:hypothetical protein
MSLIGSDKIQWPDFNELGDLLDGAIIEVIEDDSK